LCPHHQEKIIDIPNGVNPSLLTKTWNQVDEITGGIAFWGGLDFSPNTTAVHYFYDEIFLPYLSDKEINWFIIGRNPSSKMQKMAEKHKNISLTGYVEDLYEFVSRIPIMVNPMQIGSGLKNKVLEAFALERLVISNQLGVEAIPAIPGVHYINAGNPKEFAQAILEYSSNKQARKQIGMAARCLVEDKYKWDTVSREFCAQIDNILETAAEKRH
jgi:glycosyltransferase involved in cell wall biosynthesis